MLPDFDDFQDSERDLGDEAAAWPPLLDDPSLESLLGQLDDLSPEAVYPLQTAFYQQLLRCSLLVALPGECFGSASDWREEGLPVLMMENQQGEKALPVFTSAKHLARWLGDEAPARYVAIPFATVCGYALEARVDFVIVNVAGPLGCEIAFHDFSYLAEGLLPPPSLAHPAESRPGHRIKGSGEMQVAKDTPMRLGASAVLPPGLLERLLHLLQSHREMVNRAYVFEIAFNDGPLQPAIAVRIPAAYEAWWEQDLWPTLQAVIYEMLERRTMMNVFLLNHAGGLEAQLGEVVAPVFVGQACSQEEPKD